MSEYFDFLKFANVLRLIRVMLFLGKWLMRLMAASVEAYLHSNFGRRYVWMLIGAFFLFFFGAGMNPSPAPLTGLFLVGLIVLVIHHLIHAFHRHRYSVAEPHSSSSGDSWHFWQGFGLAETTVQLYLEPALCILLGLIVAKPDPFLALWLAASGVSLFIKKVVNHFKHMRRVIDSMDAKIEAQRLNTTLTQFQQKPGQSAQKSHRARFASSGQKPRP